MKLTGKQKKYLKKYLRQKSIEQIAADLNADIGELKEYLQKRLGKEKYFRIVQIQKSPQKETILSSFRLKTWLIKKWPILILLAILVFAVYANSLNNDMLSDDLPMIRDNPEINKITYFWNPPYFDINLRTIIVYLTHRFFDFNPVFYRLNNILFHLGTVWVIYLLTSLLLSPFAALAASSIFAVHSLLAEPVTWISGGAYVMGAFFCLASLSMYILAKKNKRLYPLAIVSAILAAEKVIVLPPLIFMYELCFGDLKTYWKKLVPFFGIEAIWSLWFSGLIGKKIASLAPAGAQDTGFHNPLVQIPTAISSYLKLIFWPDKLTLYHSELSFSRAEFLFILFIFAMFLAVSVYFLKKERRVFFWLSFFVICLSPTLIPFKVAWVVAERYAYPCALGIFVVAATALDKLGDKLKNKWFSFTIFGVIILSLSVRTIIRNTDWKNQDNLWLAAAKTSPSSPQNHNNLGDLYMRRGNLDQAIIEFQTATRLKPDYADAFHNLANTYYQKGNKPLAKKNYEKAITFNKNLWQSYQNLANMYFEEGNIATAGKYLLRASEINPGNENLQIDLAVILSKSNRKTEALAIINKILAVNPMNAKAKRALNEIEIN